MTRHDQRILFMAFAFNAFVVKGENMTGGENVPRIRQLAALFETFCRENAAAAFPGLDLPEETGVAFLDEAINRHVKELRQQEVTQLPESREALLQLYDRLHMRQFRRQQREFYATATADKLADLVLEYLDEEIHEQETLT